MKITQVTLFRSGTYTVSAEITAGTEVITFTEDIIISQNPTAFTTDDLFVCDDNNDGVSSFTFQESGDDIINGQDTAVYSISYHLSLADAENNANPINLPYQNTNSTEEILSELKIITIPIVLTQRLLISLFLILQLLMHSNFRRIRQFR